MMEMDSFSHCLDTCSILNWQHTLQGTSQRFHDYFQVSYRAVTLRTMHTTQTFGRIEALLRIHLSASHTKHGAFHEKSHQ